MILFEVIYKTLIMSNNLTTSFTEENIRKLFGSIDGEGDSIDRLIEFYFKTDTFEQVTADVPLKILVGYKGIGKSALFRIAISEQKLKGNLPILIKPDDIAEIGEKHESLILTIRKWKFGLIDIIAKKVLSELGLSDDTITSNIIRMGGKIINLLTESIKSLKDNVELLPSQKILISNFLENKKIIVYLDDLDRGWQNRKEGLVMISGLINSIRDLSIENQGLSFKLALRSDVYAAVRTEDESSDKFDSTVIHHTYSLNELYVMLIKRVLTFFNQPVNETNLLNTAQKYNKFHLDPIMDGTFFGNGKWSEVPIHRVILSVIRNRPRDLVKLCTMAARQAHKEKSTIIKSNHWQSILPEYSRSIINDTIAEYKSELPSIERLIYGMKPSRKVKSASDCFVFTTAELSAKISSISQLGQLNFASGILGDSRTIKEFLYKINFITARKVTEDGFILRKNYEEDNRLASKFKDFGYDWEIHLAYRWVLQPDSFDDIFNYYPIIQ